MQESVVSGMNTQMAVDVEIEYHRAKEVVQAAVAAMEELHTERANCLEAWDRREAELGAIIESVGEVKDRMERFVQPQPAPDFNSPLPQQRRVDPTNLR